MNTKNSIKSSLENKRFIFFEIGLIIALSIVLIAFEWATKLDDKNKLFIKIEDIPDDDFTPIPIKEENKLPPKIYVADLNIVPSNLELNIENEFANFDIGINSDIQIIKLQPEDLINKSEIVDDPIIEFMLPTFLGKTPDYFGKWIASQINYPKQALESNYEFKVFISFTVNERGNIEDIIVKSNYEYIISQIKNIISTSPRWEPGIKNGKLSKFRFSFPIIFKIDYNN